MLDAADTARRVGRSIVVCFAVAINCSEIVEELHGLEAEVGWSQDSAGIAVVVLHTAAGENMAKTTN